MSEDSPVGRITVSVRKRQWRLYWGIKPDRRWLLALPELRYGHPVRSCDLQCCSSMERFREAGSRSQAVLLEPPRPVQGRLQTSTTAGLRGAPRSQQHLASANLQRHVLQVGYHGANSGML